MTRRRRRAPIGSFPNTPIWQPKSPIGGFNSRNLIVDGGFERGSIIGWAGSIADLSLSVVSPYDGDQSLRVTNNGGANRYAYQDLLVIGKTYRITGAARGDGASNPHILSLSASPSQDIWVGTASTSWQTFDVSFVAGDGWLRLYTVGADGGWTEWDSLCLF